MTGIEFLETIVFLFIVLFAVVYVLLGNLDERVKYNRRNNERLQRELDNLYENTHGKGELFALLLNERSLHQREKDELRKEILDEIKKSNTLR